MSARFSIIVPVKNGQHDLDRLLSSVQALVRPNGGLEVLICDNGSTDGTREVAHRHHCRVLELPGLTIAALRNRGAAESSGQILAFVDSDCTVHPHWLTAAQDQLQKPRVVATGSYPVPPEDCTWVQELWTLKHRLKVGVFETPWLPSMNLIITREAFDAAAGFDAGLRTCEDVDLCYRLRDRGGLILWAPKVRVTHYGEPPDLRALFQKERWHGLDNYRGVLRHGLRREEVLSLTLPLLVFGVHTLPLALIPTTLLLGPILPLLASTGMVVPPLIAGAAATRTALEAGRKDIIPKLTAIYWTYLLARAAAIIPRRTRAKH